MFNGRTVLVLWVVAGWVCGLTATACSKKQIETERLKPILNLY